jgi:diaminopimelate decarboxylase/aspartate kinase
MPRITPARKPWVVLKYGGTSVASAERWATIATRARARAGTHRVWIVASALAGVTNRLESAVRRALQGQNGDDVTEVRNAHRRLAADLGLPKDALREIETYLDELDTRLTGIRLTGEAPPRLVARILAQGELCSTRLGVAALARHGIDSRWVDARELLTSVEHPLESEHHRFLEARIPVARAPEPAEAAAGDAGVVLTQGFIARTSGGDTCLLGRGGSDTSAALFAALLGAEQLEIWTDVHGLFTADPRLVPSARLIRRTGFREAQELAAMGAKVLHPRCLEPVAEAGIPLTLHSIEDPDTDGTRIEAVPREHVAVTAVTCRTNVTLISVSTLEMWHAPGYLARTFQPFDELGISVDLVATSQSTVSVTLDRLPGGVEGPVFSRLLARLESIGRVTVVHPCAVVSIVGQRIRAALHELGPAMSVFQDRPVHLVSDSADDLNLSFVVDEHDAQPLVVRLHEHLFTVRREDGRFGSSWEELHARAAAARPSAVGAAVTIPGARTAGAEAPRRSAKPAAAPARSMPWWRRERERLIALAADGRARYVYHLPSVSRAARRLREGIPSVDRFYYAMKANGHPAVLERVVGEGLGIECVSLGELERARGIGNAAPILFTPNFCPVGEYGRAFAAGAEVVVDGPEPLVLDRATFQGRDIGVRLDPGRGLGHHEKVRTAGARAKFGHPIEEIDPLAAAAAGAGARIVGLHAHIGSGIFDPDAWAVTAAQLVAAARRLSDVRWIDVGGGLGVPERPGQGALDLGAVEAGLAAVHRTLESIELRLEPGRYLVSEAGVLIAPVTQVRRKGDVRYVGVATGMNSFIRPALYGAWHGIHNLSRLDEPPDGYWHVVGPICETGDVLGRDRLLPDTRAGDVLLIENAGAYGAAMASQYNLREAAAEVVLEA